MPDEPEAPTSPNEPDDKTEEPWREPAPPPPEPPPAAPGAEPPPLRPAPPGGTKAPFRFELLEDAPGCTAAVFGLPLKAWDSIAIILMTIAADLCLYTHPGGTGAAVLILVAAIGLLSLAPKTGRAVKPVPLLGVLLIAVASAWNFKAGLGVAAFFAVTGLAIKLHRPEWSISEIGWSIPWTIVLAPAKFLGHLVRALGGSGEAAAEETEPRPGRSIPWRVVLVPLGVVVLFILVFRAASPVVERLTQDVFDWIADCLEHLWKIVSIARIFTWLFWLILFAALIRPLAKSWVADALAKRRETLDPPDGPAPNNGNYATAAATLISVNLLFIAFHAVDWPYLYFKARLPEGISYSEYSHRGCFWLTVGLLLSTAVIGIVFRKRLNFHPGAGLLRGLSYVWAVLNGVLAVGALRRLQMYVDYNGLTPKRIVGIYGILLVTVGLILMVVKVRRSRNITWLIRRDLVALWTAIILIVLTPVDYLSWSYNACQAMQGNHRPLANLTRQKMSPESFPPLIPLLDYEPPESPAKNALEPETLRKGVAAILGRKLDELRKSEPKSWTEWQGSHSWALERLGAAEKKIDAITPPEARKDAESSLKTLASPWIHTRRGWRVHD